MMIYYNEPQTSILELFIIKKDLTSKDIDELTLSC